MTKKEKFDRDIEKLFGKYGISNYVVFVNTPDGDFQYTAVKHMPLYMLLGLSKLLENIFYKEGIEKEK